MMYSEFVKGTGCKDSAHNHEVFKNLEVMYMNTDMTKEEIYEYGKKLVDNSKSEAQLQFEVKMKEKIDELKDEVKWYRSKIDMYNDFIKYTNCSIDEEEMYRSFIRSYKELIKKARNEIEEIKWIMQ